MTIRQPWILPDGVDELLPESAAQLECLRRQLLTHFDSWAYDLVFPPLVEFVDALAVGAGQDLAIQTYQVIDHLSGRPLGFRPDITAQAARMDARYMSHLPVNRLCYCGSIVLARSTHLQAKRAQVQAGVELFGHSGPE
ncbi:MAG: ATP phosphoribosyltransferase regulatory subunit, partial [Gammaproteobacteria bacterium]